MPAWLGALLAALINGLVQAFRAPPPVDTTAQGETIGTLREAKGQVELGAAEARLAQDARAGADASALRSPDSLREADPFSRD